MQTKLIASWLEEQSWNSVRMLKSLEMQNLSHNTLLILHTLLAVVLKIQSPLEKLRFITAKRKLRRLLEPEVQAECQNWIKERCADVTQSCVEDGWNNLKDYLLSEVD